MLLEFEASAMVQVQIELTQEQVKQLNALAKRQNTSVIELVRSSVDALLARTHQLDWDERRRRAIAAAGRFHSGHSDLSANHDAYLEDIWASIWSRASKSAPL